VLRTILNSGTMNLSRVNRSTKFSNASLHSHRAHTRPRYRFNRNDIWHPDRTCYLCRLAFQLTLVLHMQRGRTGVFYGEFCISPYIYTSKDAQSGLSH